MMNGHILVVGSLNMDMVVRTERHPNPGETVLGSNFQTFPGGKGANQAVAAARLGGLVTMIGRVGQDAFGETLLASQQDSGVNTRHIIPTPDISTGVALITLDANGQNTIVVASGANALLSPQDIVTAEEAFNGASVLLLQLETPMNSVIQAAKMAKKHGVKVVLNPAPAQYLPEQLLKNVDYLIPNQQELALVTGIDVVTLALNALLGLGPQAVLVTLGGSGVMVAEGDENTRIDSFSVPVVDTTAAGDAFIGAFGVGLAENKTIHQAALMGNAAGAIAVTRPGAQPSLPMRTELDEFLASHTKLDSN